MVHDYYFVDMINESTSLQDNLNTSVGWRRIMKYALLAFLINCLDYKQ